MSFVCSLKIFTKLQNVKKKSANLRPFWMLLTKVFNGELSYDERRKFFTEHNLKNLPAFNAMYNLQLKRKEDIERIDNVIKNAEEVVKKHKSKQERLDELFAQKKEIQKRIEDLLKTFTHNNDYFF